MADNTRVNELQDKLLKAMDILNAQALNSISFDKTITCKIENDKDKKDGKYEVNDGNRIFTAYSSDTRLRPGDTVYVTVPEGNFENQKMIIGKKTAENDKPFNFTQPFDTFFDMTGNILGENIGNELIANAINQYDNTPETEYEQKLLIEKTDLAISNYTRLALKANFKSWIKEAVRGDYGLLIILYTKEENAINEQPKTSRYSFIFNNSDMYGNPYAFETNYSQEMVIPLEKVNGVINKIQVYFYQNHNFYDKFNEPILCSEKGYLTEENTNIYIKDDKGNYQLKENDTLLSPNLFVNNVYLSFGYDISIFTDDYVEIYTQNRNSYRRSTEVGNTYIEENQKEIKMRWVHLKDGNPVDMVTAAGNQPNEAEPNYEVRWYRYSVGAAAADQYCGVYWIEEKRGDFNLTFNPDVNKQQEKIKAIVLCDGIPYRSNELIFENEEQLPPSKEAQHIMTALTITTDDDTNGNYMIYGQDNSIKDTEYGKIQRSLSVWFDANNDGELSVNEEITDENQATNLTWTFPAQNTMINVVDPNKIEIKENEGTENEKIIAYQIHTCSPWYKIASYYTPNKSNNTITCEYQLNGRVYTTEKEFTFGPAGTMGTDQTLVIDFVGDVNAVNKADEADNNINIEIQLYDNQNIVQDIPEGGVQWAWYYNGDLDNGTIKFPFVIEGKTNKQITFTKDQFDIDSLYILQATVGDLTTYFPIPIQSGGYSFIKGPTQVIYQADGEPAYSREAYALYSGNTDTLTSSWVKVCKTADEDKLRYTGTIDEKTHKLKPLSIYVKDAPIYGVQAKNGTATLWTQPILVLQNQWPNGVINKWDGESLVLDEANSTILAAALSAGKKNDDNTFSGVMIGDWEGQDVEGSITEQTGVYGFHHGAMSYAFKEDGTAFIGKSSMARINFDGSNATIYSSGYNTSSGGMMLNLYNGGKPFIELKSAVTDDGKQSSMRFDTENSGSTIYMKNGINQFIKISNDDVENPLEVGENFSVDWHGNIIADGGTIGSWEIVDGKLQSDDEKIVLSTEGTGTILINEDDIIIKGAYNREPTQITLSSNSVIHGGIIEAGTLSSTGDKDGRIQLNGYLQLYNESESYLGAIESNIGGNEFNYNGLGIKYNDAVFKATGENVGMSYNGSNYFYIDSSGIHAGGQGIDFRNIGKDKQLGIYARFA